MVNLASYKTQIQEAKESNGAAQVPSGDYVVVCVSTEEKQNSKQNGHYIQNNYEIQGGEHAGSVLIDRINFDNPNETARNIAFSTLKQLGKAINLEVLDDTNQLIGKRIVARVKNEPSDRPVLDDNGNQKIDVNGSLIFYKNINITKYMPYTVGAASVTPVASEPTQPKPSSFPFPKRT